MNKQDEQKTDVLRMYVKDPKHDDIRNIEEDDTFLYFEVDLPNHALILKTMDFETMLQERTNKDRTTYYRVRVLKPNWFTSSFSLG